MAAPSVTSPAPPALLTLDEFYALPNADDPMELVRGEVIPLSPAHGPASTVAGNIFWLLSTHVRPRRLGRVWGDNTGFALLGAVQTSRSPDVAFIRAERLPAEGIGPGPIRIAPDLAVEVLSPHESASYLEEKLADYREAGTPLLWVVDPRRRFVTVHSAGAAPRTLRVGAALDGVPVLPDFRCEVAELFEGVAPH